MSLRASGHTGVAIPWFLELFYAFQKKETPEWVSLSLYIALVELLT
jgi:hypothetical protein